MLLKTAILGLAATAAMATPLGAGPRLMPRQFAPATPPTTPPPNAPNVYIPGWNGIQQFGSNVKQASTQIVAAPVNAVKSVGQKVSNWGSAAVAPLTTLGNDAKLLGHDLLHPTNQYGAGAASGSPRSPASAYGSGAGGYGSGAGSGYGYTPW